MTYRCNEVKFKSERQCEAQIYLLYHSENSDISLYRSSSDHKHDVEGVTTVFKFSAEEEALIREMFKQNLKPKSIMFALAEKSTAPPPASKLQSFLKTLRQVKYGKEKLHLGTLEAWLKESITVPHDNLQPFVANYEIDTTDDLTPKFRLVFCSCTNCIKLLS